MFNLKQALIGTLISAVLASGSVGASLVNAQDTPTDPAPTAEPAPGGRGGFFGGRGGPFGGRNGDFGVNIDRAEVQALLETYTGLTSDELREQLRAGATLTALIEANGQSVEAFVAEAAQPVFDRIDEAVASGRMDAARAEELKANVTERLTNRLENPQPRRDGPLANRLDGEILALAEGYTGLSADELREQLRNGATLADLITANGGDVDAFIAEAVVVAEADIDERVAQQKANLPAIITALVNGERPAITPPAAAGN